MSDNTTQSASKSFARFLDVIKRLRAPGGCPWDIEQTPKTLRTPLVEETFEALDAIDSDDATHIKEELGDVLLNTIMICYMEEQSGDFTIANCIDNLTEKLIRRHPHVFAKDSCDAKITDIASKMKTSEEVLRQWDVIKDDIEGRKTQSILDEVPKGFPPLLRAYKLQKKAAKKGFDWDDAAGAKEKITEELNELQAALNKKAATPCVTPTLNKIDEQNNNNAECEAGDLIFAVVNYIRKLGIDPNVALNRTNKKFYDRFCYVEKQMVQCNTPMNHDNMKKMDNFWEEAKGQK